METRTTAPRRTRSQLRMFKQMHAPAPWSLRNATYTTRRPHAHTQHQGQDTIDWRVQIYTSFPALRPTHASVHSQARALRAGLPVYACASPSAASLFWHSAFKHSYECARGRAVNSNTHLATHHSAVYPVRKAVT